MVNFPFYDRTAEVFSDSVKSAASKNKAALLKNYDSIFTKSVKAAIAKGKPYTKTKGEEQSGRRRTRIWRVSTKQRRFQRR
ncbi:MAG: hypothetical protein HC846_13285 [Blastocatellia bacterium]|nr:hypothetical protein [Blastocatellia bacterium]